MQPSELFARPEGSVSALDRSQKQSRHCALAVQSSTIPQLQFIEGRRHPCLYAKADPLVAQKTMEIPQFVDTVAGVPVVRSCRFSRAGRRLSCRDAEADHHDPGDHGDSPVAVFDFPVAQVVQVVFFFVAQRRFPMVQAVQQTMVLPQLQFIDKVIDVPVCRLGSSARGMKLGRALCSGTGPGLTDAMGAGVAGSPTPR